jgi:hypothetical protein
MKLRTIRFVAVAAALSGTAALAVPIEIDAGFQGKQYFDVPLIKTVFDPPECVDPSVCRQDYTRIEEDRLQGTVDWTFTKQQYDPDTQKIVEKSLGPAPLEKFEIEAFYYARSGSGEYADPTAYTIERMIKVGFEGLQRFIVPIDCPNPNNPECDESIEDSLMKSESSNAVIPLPGTAPLLLPALALIAAAGRWRRRRAD